MGTSHCGPMCLVQIFGVGRSGSVGSLERAVPFIRTLIVRAFIRLETLVFHVLVASVFKVSVAFASCWTLIGHTPLSPGFNSQQDGYRVATPWYHGVFAQAAMGRGVD